MLHLFFPNSLLIGVLMVKIVCRAISPTKARRRLLKVELLLGMVLAFLGVVLVILGVAPVAQLLHTVAAVAAALKGTL